ncbi:hypothetical protein JW824_14380 [bacterium]|nr:hypothetical protein [bacterium]
MKSYFLIIVLLILNLGCETDFSFLPFSNLEHTSSDDSSLPDSVKRSYLDDAARLAIRYLFDQNSPDTASVIIPEGLIQWFYDGLISIHNCEKLPYVDYLTQSYPVHTFKNPDLYHIGIMVYESYEWTFAWRDGERLTGNSDVDSLMVNYDLILEDYHLYSGKGGAELKSLYPLNLFALSELFEEIEGVRFSEPLMWMGGSKDIQAIILNGGIQYIFCIGWGDCMAGCMYSHYWEYIVYPYSAVQFIKEYGDPLNVL